MMYKNFWILYFFLKNLEVLKMIPVEIEKLTLPVVEPLDSFYF